MKKRKPTQEKEPPRRRSYVGHGIQKTQADGRTHLQTSKKPGVNKHKWLPVF